MQPTLTVALAGNPNAGKTTLFNNLTGSRQHVGNYPGVTVEKKTGRCRYHGHEIDFVDLPGTYSLTAHSLEERVARRFILEEKPDVVVDVLDASNLERNLYLGVQLMELKVPLVLVFNMSDVARSRGIEFDIDTLSHLLGTRIVSTVGHRNRGTDDLLQAIVETAALPREDAGRVEITYGPEIEDELAKLAPLAARLHPMAGIRQPRWLALKLLENDEAVTERATDPELTDAVARSIRHLEQIRGDAPEILIADRRYGFISGAATEAVRSSVEDRHTRSDRIDAVLTNRVIGLPIFLALMYAVFYLVFTLGEVPMGWVQSLLAWVGGAMSSLWPEGSDSILKSLMVDGIIGGVGGVIVFLPNILLLFLAIAFLEDTGYMARAAFLMDRLMHKIGLHGKSFIPMLIGLGCSVPAIMATRTLDTRRDRLATMLVVPLMSCGARLPIYTLLIAAFFPGAWRGPMLWLMYLIGIGLAVVCAKILRATVFKGETHHFVMELPPYRLPTLKGIFIHMWHRAWLYLRKAGTIILAVSVVLWFLTRYPQKVQMDVDYDQAAATARDEYLTATRQFNRTLNLPAESNLLADAARGRALPPQTPAAVSDFLTVRDRVIQARHAFDDTTEGSEIPAAELALAIARRDAALGDIRHASPEHYATVIAFLDTVQAPFHDRLQDLAHQQQAEELAYSAAGRAGHAMEPVIKPLGFDWKIGTALIGAFAAKEVFVAQMGIVNAVGETDEQSQTLHERLAGQYSPLQAFCIMLFCLIASPCMATLAVTKQESGAWKWPLLQWGGLTAMAYVLTLGVYQIGRAIS